ncbi:MULTISPECIES: hypothetical protein [unclassified Coleofasciculus]|uniref:hypothetical protein n=1 Tax=unclassified Coleofasciculus TaxID=2692782 RepID=UPI0018820E00|nr:MULTISPECIES: hypothetical protein [unclassified Coleofasciculus]MBE9127689.1 hypothetical protein [Coleofasciculus sp. LEGE 07081]MBE9151027.1 hypothetical protein [Coleofasciculus sp. LEGE 07092]
MKEALNCRLLCQQPKSCNSFSGCSMKNEKSLKRSHVLNLLFYWEYNSKSTQQQWLNLSKQVN